MKDLIAFLKARYDEAEEMATFARGQVPLRRPGDGSGHARPHHFAGSTATCTRCGTVRPVEGDLVPPASRKGS